MSIKLGKHDQDLFKGRTRRDNAVANANQICTEMGALGRFVPIHKSVHVKSLKEKQDDCIERNFVREDVGEKGMALHYFWESIVPGKHVPFIFMPWDAHGAYIKIPADARNNVEQYLSRLDRLGYYIMVIKDDKEEITYSPPIRMSIVKEWPHHLATSKKNEGRLVFTIPLKKIYCRGLTDPGGLLDHHSILDKLESLLK